LPATRGGEAARPAGRSVHLSLWEGSLGEIWRVRAFRCDRALAVLYERPQHRICSRHNSGHRKPTAKCGGPPRRHEKQGERVEWHPLTKRIAPL
jgi:hypothetical protein